MSGVAQLKRAAGVRAAELGDEPVAGPLVLDMARYVPAMLIHISNKMSTGANATYRRLFGASVTDWRVLSQLAIEPNIPAQRICEVIGFDKAIVSRVVRALQSRGLVRISADESDSRRLRIALTSKGWKLHDRMILVALERERLLLSGLTPKEVDLLCDLLSRLHDKVRLANDCDADQA